MKRFLYSAIYKNKKSDLPRSSKAEYSILIVFINQIKAIDITIF